MTWSVGDQVILASTSRNPGENEQLSITSVSDDNRTLDISPSIKYKHISIEQAIAGRRIETRAEVGLLTRNVVVEGSDEEGRSQDIRECVAGFDPGMFATQTCFQGRYGAEKGEQEYGAQIMINSRRKSQGLVTGRLSYIEVRNAGQPFQLGKIRMNGFISKHLTRCLISSLPSNTGLK